MASGLFVTAQTALLQWMAARGVPALALSSLPNALFFARSVAFFEVSRLPKVPGLLEQEMEHLGALPPGGPHRTAAPRDRVDLRDLTWRLADVLADALWRQAAGEILARLDTVGELEARAGLLGLRDALDRVSLDGASCRMMDGLDAFAHGDLGEAAEAAQEAWVRDGKAQDLVRWLQERGGRDPELQQARALMDLTAWALHDVSLTWGGTPAEFRQLEDDALRACDWLLFRAPCRRRLSLTATGRVIQHAD